VLSISFSQEKIGRLTVFGGPYAFLYMVENFLFDTGTAIWGKRLKEHLKGKVGLFLTHSHYDHVGGYPYIKDMVDHVLAHPHLFEVLAKEKVQRFIEEMNRKEMKLFGEYDPNYKFDPITGYDLKNGLMIVLKEGDDEGYVEVVFTPGHTRDSVSYYIFPERIMIVGEAAGIPNGRGDYIHPQFLSSVTDYLNSIRILRRYDIEILALPHVKFIQGKRQVKDYLRLSEAATKRYLENLIGWYADCGGDYSCIEAKVMEEIYQRYDLKQPRHAFLKNLKAQIRAVEREFLT